jgi:hypothetical protein
MKLGTHMPEGEKGKPIAIEVCRSKVKVILSIHMLATRLSHLWCVTDFLIHKVKKTINTTLMIPFVCKKLINLSVGHQCYISM